MSEAHLDDAVLSALQDVMAEEFPLLLETFVGDSEERLRGLREALQHADAHALRHTAHSFKGSCGNMGALRLTTLCKQLEDLARHGNLGAAAPLVAEVESEFATVRRLLEAYGPSAS